MANEIIIFVGPSISIDVAKKILPQATYLPPVKCGDILRVLRLQPKIIAIIDGFFENTAAVWHKEILFALSKGVKVYGAGSMGALRATELENFGMLGVGTIFKKYKAQEITDDDEVCVFHRPKQSLYEPISDAMVNIRVTIDAALKQNIIDQATAQEIVNVCKAQNYKDRSLNGAVQSSIKDNPSNKEALNNFQKWLNDGNYINQKKLDCIELLTQLAKLDLNNVMNHENNLEVQPSLFLRTLILDTMCQPLLIEIDSLPIAENIALYARFLGDEYILNRYLAYLLAAADAILNKYGVDHFDIADYQFTNKLFDSADNPYSANDNLFKARLARIDHFIQKIKRTSPLGSYIQYIKIIANINPKSGINQKLLNCISELWSLLDWHIQQLNISVSVEELQAFANSFRTDRQLFSSEATYNWMATQEFDGPAFEKMLLALYQIDYFLLKNNLDQLGIRPRKGIWWLWDALRLSVSVNDAVLLFDNKTMLKNKFLLLKKFCSGLNDFEKYLKQLDFFEDQAELQKKYRLS